MDFNQSQYQNNFQIYVENNTGFEVGGGTVESRVKLLSQFLPIGKSVFEIGSGIGADALELKRVGYRVIASDFVEKFLQELKVKNLDTVYFDAKSDELPETVDAVYANAVFVHLSINEILELLKRISIKLNSNGLIFISVIKGEGSERSARSKGFERDFYYYTLTSLTTILNKSGFNIIHSVDNDTKWLQIIAIKKGI